MRSKSIVLLALALGCGLIASIGISQVMEKRNAVQFVQGETEAIFVALTDINPNDPITPQNVKIEEWPKGKVPAGAVTKMEELDGKRCKIRLFAGEPILAGKLIDKDALNNASPLIPKGYRVVAVRVDAVSGGGSLILPGDRVDVLVYLSKNPSQNIFETSTKTILQDIKVFAVDTTFQRNPGEDEPAVAAKTISLLVTPQQAEKVMLATEMGSVRLTLRNGDDPHQAHSDGARASDVSGTEGSDRDSEHGAPPAAAPAHAPAAGPGVAGAVGNLLDFIKEQGAKQQAHAAATPQADEHWKMKVFKGAEISEVEMNGDNGLPITVAVEGQSAAEEKPAERIEGAPETEDPLQEEAPRSNDDGPASDEPAN